MQSTQDFVLTNELSEQQYEQLLDLFSKEWWTKGRTRQDVNAVLSGCSFYIGIADRVTDQLVGFARVLTDYYKYAYIYDVIVDEGHRGRGVGRLILENIIKHPRLCDIKNLELTCADKHIPFYEQFGFSRDYGDSYPMRRSNPESTNS